MSEGPSIKALQRQIEALEARNRLLDTLLENLPVGVFMADADSGKPMLANPRAEALLGRSVMEDADADTLAEAYQAYRSDTGTLYPAEEMPIVQAMKGRHHHVDDMAVVHPDGSRVLLEVFGTPVRDDSGAIVASLVSFQDITESQRTKTELSRLFDMSLDMICIADITTATFLKVNPAFTRILGYSVEELQGRPFLEFTHPDDVDATSTVVAEKLRRGDKVVNFKNRYRCKDGTYRWLSWTSHPDPQKGLTYAIAHDITEEQAAADSCAALAAQWQTTFDAVNDCIWVLDGEWTVIQANKATVANLGITAAQAIGRKCYEIVHGSASPFENCPVKSVIKTGQRAVELVRRGDRWLEITADPVFNADGSIKNIVHIITDITQRKRSDEALRQSEETLKSIFRAAPTGIGMVKHRIITQANDRLCEMTGRNRDELLNKDARILYPSDEDYNYVGREKYRQIRAKGTGTVETRWLRKNGTVLDVLLSSTPINAEDLREGVTFTALDITERKHAERRLAAAHEMFLTVLDSIDATIYVADMDTFEILFMNRHMIENFGGDLTGQICWNVFRNSNGPCTDCTNPSLMDDEGTPTGVHVWHDQNPVNGRWYINYDRAITWVDGRTVRIQIATDITDLKNLERQLQQSQKMEAIGNLAGGIAHDFNNILSAVIGYSELSLYEVDRGSELEKKLLEINKAGLRARNLVKQILTFARRSEKAVKPVNLAQIAVEALKLLRSTLPASIAIEPALSSEWLVMADPTQIHQIVMNLCTNAAHAMVENGGVLEFRVSDVRWDEDDHRRPAVLPPGLYIEIVVSDTGEGIPEDHLASIFDPYFTTKPTGKGTGLGLAVVHGIIKDCGGEIFVESAPGSGTVFRIYLPALRQAPQRSAESAAATESPGGSEHILFVDDEPAICATGAEMLERLGYAVTACTSSPEALERFRSQPDRFDIVITDMTMPKLNGDRLAAEMLKIRPGVPIILCTGYSSVISHEKAAALGIRAMALKPLTFKDLSAVIRKALDEAPDTA